MFKKSQFHIKIDKYQIEINCDHIKINEIQINIFISN